MNKVTSEITGEELPPITASMSAADLIAYNNYVMGRVLTVVDASATNPQQAKAMKDLMKTAFWSAYDSVKTWMENQTEDRASSFPFGREYMASVE